MKKRTTILLLIGLYVFAVPRSTAAQTTDSILNFGVWQTYGDPMDITQYPEIKGRLCNVNWKDLEVANNIWVWDTLDNDLAARVKDSLPVIFLVYTEEGAPDWLYSSGVPKVEQNDNGIISYCPYYANNRYKNYFKRMITTVRQHIDSLPYGIRKWIIGVQGCFGSTGDYIGYKGTVDPKYALTGAQFYSLFQEFSLYYYNEYLNTNPKIYLLSNPLNNGQDQMNWLLQYCPNGWIKCGSLGKGFQLNDEKTKYSWLYPLLNNPQSGAYIRSRSELQINPSAVSWWSEYRYRNMFALMTYCIYWGLDWSSQSPGQIIDKKYDEAFAFYNKYAGQKNASTATNAMCALRDGLDASDTIRFSTSIYGALNRYDTMRYRNIANKNAKFGARLEDAVTATSTELNNLVATGINDVGWDVFSGNYDRYLHQIKANETSTGYWNVNAINDTNSIYGKFARGINTTNGKDALYFDIDSLFFNKSALNAAYPVVIDITYLDNGKGTFTLYYDSKTDSNKQSNAVTLVNSGTWKKFSVTINDAYFGNRGFNSSDFYIKASTQQTVVISLVELSRPDPFNPQPGLQTPTQIQFDTTCVLATGQIKSFVLKGNFLNGSKISIGQLSGYSYSISPDSAFTDSLSITNYGTGVNMPIYVKFNPLKNAIYSGNISITGGGYKGVNLKVRGIGINSRPTLSASISNVSCNNAKDGAIDITISGGTGPFSYSWISDSSSSFKSTAQDISALTPANYSVTVNSFAGCAVTSTYTVTQPNILVTSIKKDSDIVCKGGTTTVTITATGGTLPYNGIGSFTVESSNVSFIVTDAHGCSDETDKLTIPPGTLTPPSKPVSITGNDQVGVCYGGIFKYRVDTVATATSYNWIIPSSTAIAGFSSTGNGISLSIPAGLPESQLLVSAVNVCGSSTPVSKTISPIPDNPAGINGPVNVLAGQTDLIYKVVSPSSLLSYTWSSSAGNKITAGQDTWKVSITWGALDGRVTVKANNACGTSGPADLDVKIVSSLISKAASATNIKSSTSKEIVCVPNPANTYTEIFFSSQKSIQYELRLCDFDGKILLQKRSVSIIGDNHEKINMQQFAKGVYFVAVIFSDGIKKTSKVIKQ